MFHKYPDMYNYLVDKITDYDDSMKFFFEKALSSVDYLKDIAPKILNEMIFQFVPRHFEKGEIIFSTD